ncbi:MAG TPA: hypothetical protein V6C88_02665 [Chroococcidiopsis sp.]
MFLAIRLIPGAIAEMFAEVSASGKITLADRYGLLAAIVGESLGESLSDDERGSIDRILYGIYRGQLKIVDELSSLL